MKIVIINGKPESGKDTFVALCQDILGEELVYNTSTVDFVKEVAIFCGWNGIKNQTNRQFLSNLKDLLSEWDDVPLKKTLNAVNSFKRQLSGNKKRDMGLVFIHCREPEEIDKLITALSDLGEVSTLLIRRTENESAEQSNHADADVFNYSYDYTIYNDSTIPWLRDQAIIFLRNYLKFNI